MNKVNPEKAIQEWARNHPKVDLDKPLKKLFTWKGGDSVQPGVTKPLYTEQGRGATEKDVDIRYMLIFQDGLSLAGDEPEKLTERLVRFATGAALVEAVAEAQA